MNNEKYIKINHWFNNSPVITIGYYMRIYKDENDQDTNRKLAFVFKNIYKKNIIAIKTAFTGRDAFGNVIGEVNIDYPQIEKFTLNTYFGNDTFFDVNIKSVYITLKSLKLAFSDGTTWSSDIDSPEVNPYIYFWNKYVMDHQIREYEDKNKSEISNEYYSVSCGTFNIYDSSNCISCNTSSDVLTNQKTLESVTKRINEKDKYISNKSSVESIDFIDACKEIEKKMININNIEEIYIKLINGLENEKIFYKKAPLFLRNEIDSIVGGSYNEKINSIVNVVKVVYIKLYSTDFNEYVNQLGVNEIEYEDLKSKKKSVEKFNELVNETLDLDIFTQDVKYILEKFFTNVEILNKVIIEKKKKIAKNKIIRKIRTVIIVILSLIVPVLTHYSISYIFYNNFQKTEFTNVNYLNYDSYYNKMKHPSFWGIGNSNEYIYQFELIHEIDNLSASSTRSAHVRYIDLRTIVENKKTVIGLVGRHLDSIIITVSEYKIIELNKVFIPEEESLTFLLGAYEFESADAAIYLKYDQSTGILTWRFPNQPLWETVEYYYTDNGFENYFEYIDVTEYDSDYYIECLYLEISSLGEIRVKNYLDDNKWSTIYLVLPDE
jgi:hypothetical protein